MDKLKCKIGFTTTGFTQDNKNNDYKINIKQNDIVDVDEQGYLWKNGICFGHKDSKFGKENFVAISQFRRRIL
jgi:hypothetical protein